MRRAIARAVSRALSERGALKNDWVAAGGMTIPAAVSSSSAPAAWAAATTTHATRSLHSWRMVPQPQRQAIVTSALQQQHTRSQYQQQQQQQHCCSIHHQQQQQQQQQDQEHSNPWLARGGRTAAFSTDGASSKPSDADAKPSDAAADAAASSSSSGDEDAAAGAAGEQEAPLSVEQLTAELAAREAEAEGLQAKVADLADQFKRSLADMENLRQRTTRQVENAQKFAVEPIIKALLDVADNLERAAAAVPAAALDGSEPLAADRAAALLKSLLEGVSMTQGTLMAVFKKHGVQQYDPSGEAFDPNLHSAMFEVPDATKEAGRVAVVTKRGYMMHDRVLRAAEVGVYRAP